ncbi:hypothetical protein L226DRAFT_606911 [Lentinus tigrinus ALCF2SS1-7]|uniref:uncharacterized protein n=1 Tax=Lentinus tigrinus ALCF2SS1-7 TaxID=1328758 RepID=UPI001165D72E|nr:hypothetical protein L226DRAFT_606911 [Lentinus tigrinus ALCF2SS1-7]
MSPIRTRARAARRGQENIHMLAPEAAGKTPQAVKTANLKKYPGTPHTTRTAVPRKIARRNTIFVIEQGGKQRQILADRRLQINVVQAQDLALQERRKAIQPASYVPKPDDSPDSPNLPEEDASHAESDAESSASDADSVGAGQGQGQGQGEEERHVHWTDGIRNRAGTVILPARVPEPANLRTPRRMRRQTSFPRSILQVPVYRDSPVTPRKPAASTPYRARRSSILSATPVFDFSPPGITMRTRERSRSRSGPLVMDADLTPTGSEERPFIVDDTPRGFNVLTTHTLGLGEGSSARHTGSNEASNSGTSQATTTRNARQLLSTASATVKYPSLHDELTVALKRRTTTQDAIGEALAYDDAMDDSGDALQVPARMRFRLFRLPQNRVDRCFVVFSLVYFSIAIPMLLRIYGFV